MGTNPVFTILSVMLVGFGLILGLCSPSRAFRRLGRIVILTALTPLLLGMAYNWWSHLPLGPRVLIAVVAFASVVLVGLRWILGARIFSHIMGNFFYDLLKGLVLLPVRLLSMIGRIVARPILRTRKKPYQRP